MHQEGVVGEDLARRMASKCEKVVDKAVLLTFDRKLIICGRSVGWWDGELHQLVKDCRASFAPDLDSDSKGIDYLGVSRNYN